MMVETVVDVKSTINTAQIANALTPKKAGLRILSLRQKMAKHLKKHRISPTQDGLVILRGHK